MTPGEVHRHAESLSQAPPPTSSESGRCLLESVALASRRSLEQAGAVTGSQPEAHHVVGGGPVNQCTGRQVAAR